MTLDKIITKTKEINKTKNKGRQKCPKVAIIILNWNGWKDTIECLESVFRNTYLNYQVMVVDNGSTDGSIEKIKAWADGKQEVLTPESIHPLFHLSHPSIKKPFPYIYYTREEAEKGGNFRLEEKVRKKWQEQRKSDSKEICPTSSYPIILIQTGENLGFAGGNNVGMRYVIAKKEIDYIWLLNNDTAILNDTLIKLIKAMDTNLQFGAATPRIYHYNGTNCIWNSGGRLTIAGSRYYFDLNRVLRTPETNTSINKITFITGCALLIHRNILEKCGFLSEDFFIGEEDYEFSLRMKKYRVKMACIKNTCIYHKTSRSSQKLFKEKINSSFIHHLNRFIHLKHCYPCFYWHLWRIGALCYILFIFYFKYHVNKKYLYSYCKKLIRYSDKYNKVTKEVIFRAQEEGFK